MPARSTLLNCVVLPAALAVLTVAVFGQVLRNEFVDFDDDFYVYANPQVQQGLSAESIRWAFTTFDSGAWCPLDWLSLELDAQLFGPKPRGYHLTSLVLHVVNALLLYALLNLLTRRAWPSFLVAALFAVHPLHVESVAWVAARQDVLGAFFMLLSLLAYAGYALRGRRLYYAASLAAYTLGLLTTPILAVWPPVLLLLDFWPLGRFGPTESRSRLLWEKAPYIVLAAMAGAIAWQALHRGILVAPIQMPLMPRLLNALESYGDYVFQMFVPLHLAVFYPHPAMVQVGSIPLWKPPLAFFGLLLVTVWTIAVARRRPYLLVGWAWYFVTLLPVIGLVQIGGQARADRFTYLPLVGLFIMLAWLLRDWADGRGGRKAVACGLATVALAGCALLTWRQVGVWHDSYSLWRHAVAVTDTNYMAHGHLTSLAIHDGDLADALRHAEAEVRIAPWEFNAQKFVGDQYCDRGDYEDAIPHYEQAAKFGPPEPSIHLALAKACFKAERFDDAKTECEHALRHNPNSAEALSLLGQVQAAQHELSDALDSYQAALRVDRAHVETLGALRQLVEQAEADGAAELSNRIRKTLARYSN